MARRNCELTERLGDVFSRSLALANLGCGAAGRGGVRGRRSSRSKRPSASTARRWATAARWRPGGTRCGPKRCSASAAPRRRSRSPKRRPDGPRAGHALGPPLSMLATARAATPPVGRRPRGARRGGTGRPGDEGAEPAERHQGRTRPVCRSGGGLSALAPQPSPTLGHSSVSPADSLTSPASFSSAAPLLRVRGFIRVPRRCRSRKQSRRRIFDLTHPQSSCWPSPEGACRSVIESKIQTRPPYSAEATAPDRHGTCSGLSRRRTRLRHLGDDHEHGANATPHAGRAFRPSHAVGPCLARGGLRGRRHPPGLRDRSALVPTPGTTYFAIWGPDAPIGPSPPVGYNRSFQAFRIQSLP